MQIAKLFIFTFHSCTESIWASPESQVPSGHGIYLVQPPTSDCYKMVPTQHREGTAAKETQHVAALLP